MPAPWLFVAVGRRQSRSLAVIVVLIGLTAGAVLAAVAGARRSASSVDRFERAAHEMEAFVTTSEGGTEPLRPLLEGPLVRSFTELTFVFAGPAAEGSPEIFVFAPVSPTPSDIGQGVLLEGRRIDPTEPDEVVLFETTAELLGVHAGETLDLATLSPAQAAALLETGELSRSTDGPTIPLRVVGVARNVKDLAAQPGDANFTILSPAFMARYAGEVGVGTESFAVDLMGGAESVAALSAAIERAYAGSVVPGIEAGGQTQAVEDSIAVISRALLFFAVVVALAGGIWISTAIARQQNRATEGLVVMQALGTTNGEARALLAGVFAPGLAAGVLLACAVAVLASPLLPVGLARRTDPDPGVHLDVTVLLAGSAVVLVLLAAVTWISAARAVASISRDRQTPVPSLLLDRAVRWLAPAPGTGARFAFSAPRDGSGRVRPALLGATVAVIGLVAVGVVASGIDRLLASPARWGVTWDVSVDAEAVDRQAVLDDQDVAAAAIGTFDDRVVVAGHGTLAMVLDPLKGSVLPSLVAGREPRADDEVAVGRDTLHAAGASIGDIVDVRSATERGRFRVVGVVAFPAIDSALPLADGAELSPRGAERLKIGDPAREDAGFQRLLIRWAPGVDHRAALARLGGDDIEAGAPVAPNEVTRLDEVRGFPAAIAATLVVLGAIAVSHTLGATVRRRRAELGTLSALGLVPAQRRTIIATQATSVAGAALVVGIPIGLIVGRLVWTSIAGSMGLATDASQPARQIAIGALILVLAFNVIAAPSAWAAGRMRVVDSLRAE